MIKNKTKNTIISGDFEILKGFRNKSRGLINKKTQKTVIFYTRFGIHTFGLKYPIDVLVTDGKFKIVSIKENLKPNRIFLWNPKYRNVIELKKGTVKKSKTEENDFLQINL